ncbi:MAG TPA: P-II family nitrogen regulator [Candidatus Onthomonas avicola]|nr:P-II family nitrogen regulator [Candidatus Onthomonas avicola]
MSELYLMTTIIDRKQTKRFVSFYQQCGVTVNLNTAGRGTAVSEVLDYFGLEATEKSVLFSSVTDTAWKVVRRGLQRKMKIDVPGTGVAFLIPVSSIGGKRQLRFLTEHQNFTKGEESTLKGTKYELLVVIANQGYTEQIMDAARAVGAAGGTVIHAKGTGMERAERFLGVSLAAEKEMVFIVVKVRDKQRIMRAIMDQAGLESEAKSIVFSLPVTDTAGMRLVEADEEEEQSTQPYQQ